MKKFTFGRPEKIVPSKFCKGFNYAEKSVNYSADKIKFYETNRGCVLEFPCSSGENFFGLGLQLKKANLTGGKFTLRVNSDPVEATGDSHAPVPFFVSTKGYGIYIDTARYATFYFGKKRNDKANEANVDNKIMLSTDELYKTEKATDDALVIVEIPVAKGADVYIFEGDTITEIVAQYNLLSGGGCEVPEWGLGLFYRCCGEYNQDEVLSAADYFIENNIPCDILGLEPGWQSHAYSCSLVWDKTRFPSPKSLLTALKAKGYHVNLWEHAFVHPSSPIFNDLMDKSGSYLVWDGLVPDFSIEKAQEIFANYHKDCVTYDIVDGFKLDECDDGDFRGGWSYPLCSEFPSGMDGEQHHSLFGVLYMQTMLKALGGKPTLSEVRNAGALSSSYPFVLYSDLYDHKDFICGLVTAGFSGLLWTPELRHAENKQDFIRRLQTIVFSPQCLINGWYCQKMPWLDLDCEDELKKWIKVREELKPMLMVAFKKYHETGIPPIRALVSDFTSDEETYEINDEYIFCDDLIVAPIASGETGRKVYLPQGKWVNYFTKEEQASGWFEIETDLIPVYQKVK
jgi:alpha-D-xyloside xylohydrolase